MVERAQAVDRAHDARAVGLGAQRVDLGPRHGDPTRAPAGQIHRHRDPRVAGRGAVGRQRLLTLELELGVGAHSGGEDVGVAARDRRGEQRRARIGALERRDERGLVEGHRVALRPRGPGQGSGQAYYRQ